MRKEELLSSTDNRYLKENNSQSITKTLFKNNKALTFSSGTTTVGLVCKDAVVLGTDRRATMAYFIASKIAKKLHKIQEHLWMTIAGSVADAQYLIDVIRAQSTIYQLQKGHTTIFKDNKVFVPDYKEGERIIYLYEDDSTKVDFDKPRSCPRCKQPATKEGHDACLGTLPNIQAACCGHGVQEGYVMEKGIWYTLEEYKKRNPHGC